MTVWSAASVWSTLGEVTGALAPGLERWWHRRDALLASLASEPARRTASEWFQSAEELVAMEVVLTSREVLRRIVRMLGFVVLSQAVLLGAHVFFPFQQRQLNVGVDWVYLGLGIGATLWVFAQMDRQRILCRVASETDRTRWSRDFVRKIVVYGLLPLFGLFAAYFPEVGGALFQWLQRVQTPLL